MIECKIDGHVAVITLNNPSANTFTAEGLLELTALIADASNTLVGVALSTLTFVTEPSGPTV